MIDGLRPFFVVHHMLLNTGYLYLFERGAYVWLCFEMRSLNQLVVIAVVIVIDSIYVVKDANNRGRFVEWNLLCSVRLLSM